MTNTAKSMAVNSHQAYGDRLDRETQKTMTLGRRFPVLDSSFGVIPYLTGERPTVADLYLAAERQRVTDASGLRNASWPTLPI